MIARTAEKGGLAEVHVGPANGGAARLVGCVGFTLLRARKPPLRAFKGLRQGPQALAQRDLKH